jgi:hypothetical protein
MVKDRFEVSTLMNGMIFIVIREQAINNVGFHHGGRLVGSCGSLLSHVPSRRALSSYNDYQASMTVVPHVADLRTLALSSN